MRGGPATAFIVGCLTVAAIAALDPLPFRLAAGSAGWPRLVLGAPAGGEMAAHVVIRLPGLDRHSPAALLLETTAPTRLSAQVDGGPLAPADGESVWLPAAAAPGARIDLWPQPGAPPLAAIRVVRSGPRRFAPALLAGLAAALATLAWAKARPTRSALGPGLVVAAVLAASAIPGLLLLTAPSLPSLLRLLPAAALAAAAVIASRRAQQGRCALAMLALTFGLVVRIYWLPAAGSWDTEYWKAGIARMGISGAHGAGRESPW